MPNKSYSVGNFLRYPEPGLPLLGSNFLSLADPFAIVARALVKTFGINCKFLRHNIWRHEAGRGRQFARTYKEIIGVRNFREKSLLEIGCGPGAVACGFFEFGCTVETVDLLDGRIFWHPEIKFTKGDARQCQNIQAVNYVSLTSVLHHTSAQDATLIIGRAKDVLVTEGLLLMQEDILNPRHRLVNRLVKAGDDWVSGEIGTHQAESHRAKEEWVDLVTSLGFNLVGTRSLFPRWLGVGVEKAFFVFEKTD